MAADNPAAFPARHRLAELEAKEIELTEKDRQRRDEVETLRAKVATTKADLVLHPDSGTKKLRRKIDAMEHEYLQAVQSLQEFRSGFADFVTQRRRLRLSLAGAEQAERQRLLDNPPPESRIASALHEVTEKRAAFDSALRDHVSTTVKSLIDDPNAVADLCSRGPAGTDGADTVNDTDFVAGVGGPNDAPLADGPDEVNTTLRAFLAEDGSPLTRPGDSDLELQLRSRIAESKQTRSQARRRAQFVPYVGGVLLAMLIATIVLGKGVAQAIFAAYGVVLLAAILLAGAQSRARATSASEEITDAQNELDLLRIVEDHPERRAHKLLQVNQLDLKRYYDQTLRQGRLIYYLGVGCIILGFGAIAAAIAVIGTARHSLSEQVVVAALGAVSGTLANFIGVVYLRMFSATIGSVGSFHTRLVATHDLYFGNWWLPRSKTKSCARRLWPVWRSTPGTNAAPRVSRQSLRAKTPDVSSSLGVCVYSQVRRWRQQSRSRRTRRVCCGQDGR